MTRGNFRIHRFIEHTLLKPDTTFSSVQKLCEEALEFNFFSVCLHSLFIKQAKQILDGSTVKVVTVVGFPLGICLTRVKAFETQQAIDLGADEIDMVMNFSYLKSKEPLKVEEDIRAVVEAAQGRIVKVIIETALLSNQEKVLACQIAQRAGAHFVKTSTGFAYSGATEDDVKLMKESIPESMKVKASAGIRTFDQALGLIKAGATRLGTSSSVNIMKEGNKPLCL